MMSERRACRLVGLSRTSWREPPIEAIQNAELHEQIKAIALQRRRFGYRRIHDMLKFQGVEVNHKRVIGCTQSKSWLLSDVKKQSNR